MSALRLLALCWAIGLVAAPDGVAASTLDDVRARGYLRCAVQPTHPGFAAPDAYGVWRGFDADFCRAVAAAVLGDREQLVFVSADRGVGIDSLAAGSADLVAREPDTLGARGASAHQQAGVLLHDSYGFLSGDGAKEFAALQREIFCVLRRHGAGEVIGAHLGAAAASAQTLDTPRPGDAVAAYAQGRCAAIGGLRSDLATVRAYLEDPGAHRLLALEIGKAPSGPLVHAGDTAWAKVVRWVVFALIEAEELGIDSTNVDTLRATATATAARVRELLGVAADPGAGLGLTPDWVYQVVRQVGSYGEIYARNLGPGTALDLPRTRSRLWTDGGMLFAPPAVAR